MEEAKGNLDQESPAPSNRVAEQASEWSTDSCTDGIDDIAETLYGSVQSKVSNGRRNEKGAPDGERLTWYVPRWRIGIKSEVTIDDMVVSPPPPSPAKARAAINSAEGDKSD